MILRHGFYHMECLVHLVQCRLVMRIERVDDIRDQSDYGIENYTSWLERGKYQRGGAIAR